ncbi:MAG: hypothetical protein AB1558_12205 [Thermodesulfobacteriota bacterium]
MDTGHKSPVKKLIVIALLVIAGLVTCAYWGRQGDQSPPSGGTANKEGTAEIPGTAVTVLPEAPKSAAAPVPAADLCRQSREKIQGLFSYLDRQPYVASRRLEGGTAPYFRGLLARLLKTPPHAQRETDSLMQVLENRTHLYRVLGKSDTLLLRDILVKEDQMLESAFATFHQAITLQEQCGTEGPGLRLPLQEVYPYAVFFLNTLGGTSYLMRRVLKVRTLTLYYCILILDQANRLRLNHLGLDIRPPLDSLMRDLKGTSELTRTEEYLETLRQIRTGY